MEKTLTQSAPAPRYTLGIDCGTLSARAVLVQVEDGAQLAEFEMAYPRGILTDRLPNGAAIPQGFFLSAAEDYLETLPRVVKGVLQKAGVPAQRLIGLGVDATSCTVVPCKRDGTPMALDPAYQARPHAYIKLWKHHDVKKQTAEIEQAARERGEKFLSRYGGRVSGEWMLPKVLQIYEEDRELFERTACYVDLCDWLTWRLTGVLTRSANSAGYKGLWSPEDGDISEAFLDTVKAGFGAAYHARVLCGPVLLSGSCCGRLSPAAAQWLGLPAGIAVSSGMMDGHAATIALGMQNAGEMALIIGTSNAIPFLANYPSEIKGLCGVVKDGIVPGFYGYTAGQIATGDMLGWFVRRLLPASYEAEAQQRGISKHQLLCEKAAAANPAQNPLTVLDWWNGNRSILCDQQLKGAVWGLTLATQPEEIYCAMLQGIACGTRIIIDQSRAGGLNINRIFACGGIPCKNAFFMQQYANILAMPVSVANEANSSARGSAICAAAAAGAQGGGYGSLAEAMRHMRIRNLIEYRPQPGLGRAYAAIYHRYQSLYRLLGSWDHENWTGGKG